MPNAVVRALALTAALLLACVSVWPQPGIQGVTDKISYNAGEQVRLNVLYPSPALSDRPPLIYVESPVDLAATIRYAGESEAVVSGVTVASPFLPSEVDYTTGYREIWKTPADARPGRYEIDLVTLDPKTGQVISNRPRAATFVVHKKLVRIERIELDKTFYSSGDPVVCRVVLKNLTDCPLTELRVEFSDRYWPWIAPSSDRARVNPNTLAEALSLPAGEEREVQSASAAIAKVVKEPTVHQYAVVVWDREHKDIYDIAFSPLVFIRPPGVDAPKPYPLQYIYPQLRDVDTSSHRQFYPPELSSAAIQFDRNSTMFASGSTAVVRFSVLNPSLALWRQVTICARLLEPDGKERANNLVAEKVDLAPDNPALRKEAKFSFPADASGLYRAQVEVSDAQGQVLATNTLELGVNPLPKSVLVFCAHEDDEMVHAGIIRAAVENQSPIHVVYFTSGDAGSCDRYYQHSCGPAEALNFGALRMEEARAALGYLGVRRENVHFFGLPDGGSGQIWYDHIKSSDPYLSVLLASDHAPYDGLLRPNLSYAREAVIEAVKDLISRLQPAVIYTAHPPSQGHIDHIVNNYFVVKALQELLRERAISPQLELRVDRVYDPQAQPPTPYRYAEKVLHVSGEVMARAQEAGWFYQSQGGNRAEGNLRTYGQLPRTHTYRQVLDWQEHEGWNEKTESLSQ